MRCFANSNARGIAAGIFEDAGADEAIINDHIGFLKPALGFQRHQFRITRASTHKAHTALGGVGFIGDELIQFGVEIAIAGNENVFQRAEEKLRPKGTAAVAERHMLGHPFTQGFRALHIGPKLRRQHGFHPCPHPLGQNGGRTFRANGNHQRVAVHNSRRDGGGKFRFVHHIHRNGARARGGGNTFVGFIIRSHKNQGGTV